MVPETEQTGQREEETVTEHPLSAVHSFTFPRKGPREVGFLIPVFTDEDTGSQGTKGLGHRHTAGKWPSQGPPEPLQPRLLCWVGGWEQRLGFPFQSAMSHPQLQADP